MTKIPNADAWADARRMFRWQSTVSGFLVVLLFGLSFRQVGHPNLDSMVRMAWLFLPLPGLVWAAREQIAMNRRLDEFHRMVNGRAAEIAYPLTLVWIAFVALLTTAFGFPVSDSAPLGLPPETFWWVGVIVIACAIHMVAFFVVHTRYTIRQ